MLDEGHGGSRGCLLIPTMQPFPQAVVGQKTPWSSSHHLKAFQHGPAGQGQAPERRGRGRKLVREKSVEKYNNERDLKETKAFRVDLNLAQTVSTSVVPFMRPFIIYVKENCFVVSSWRGIQCFFFNFFLIQDKGFKGFSTVAFQKQLKRCDARRILQS